MDQIIGAEARRRGFRPSPHLSGESLRLAQHLHLLVTVGANGERKRKTGKEKTVDVAPQDQGDLGPQAMAIDTAAASREMSDLFANLPRDQMFTVFLDVLDVRRLAEADAIPPAKGQGLERFRDRMLTFRNRRDAIRAQARHLAQLFGNLRSASRDTLAVLGSEHFRNELYRRWYTAPPFIGHRRPTKRRSVVNQWPIPPPRGVARKLVKRSRLERERLILPGDWYATLLYNWIASDYLADVFVAATNMLYSSQPEWTAIKAIVNTPPAPSTLVFPESYLTTAVGVGLKVREGGPALNPRQKHMLLLKGKGYLVPGALEVLKDQYWRIVVGTNPTFPGSRLLKSVKIQGGRKWFDVPKYAYYALVRRAFMRLDVLQLTRVLGQAPHNPWVIPNQWRKFEWNTGFGITGNDAMLLWKDVQIPGHASARHLLGMPTPSSFRTPVVIQLRRLRARSKGALENFLSWHLDTVRLVADQQRWPEPSKLFLSNVCFPKGAKGQYDYWSPPGRIRVRKVIPSTITLFLERAKTAQDQDLVIRQIIRQARFDTKFPCPPGWESVRKIGFRSGTEPPMEPDQTISELLIHWRWRREAAERQRMREEKRRNPDAPSRKRSWNDILYDPIDYDLTPYQLSLRDKERIAEDPSRALPPPADPEDDDDDVQMPGFLPYQSDPYQGGL